MTGPLLHLFHEREQNRVDRSFVRCDLGFDQVPMLHMFNAAPGLERCQRAECFHFDEFVVRKRFGIASIVRIGGILFERERLNKDVTAENEGGPPLLVQ